MEENKLFTPDFGKKKYSIIIDVYENCHTWKIQSPDDYKPTYHEMIGVLETNKFGLFSKQLEINKKAYAKKLKEEKKKSTP
jgi:hypothetical protein